MKDNQSKEYKYFVKGMHCASCEVLIEKKLLEQKGVEAAEASKGRKEVRVKYKGNKPSTSWLNKLFKKDNYSFFEKRPSREESIPFFSVSKKGEIRFNKQKTLDLLLIILIPALLILGFLSLNKTGLSALINVNSSSSLPTFFLFGLLAGFSTCAALVGGIILSMSKQWNELYQEKDSSGKFTPHILFNVGRFLSFTILGALLGFIGKTLQISGTFTSLLTIIISIIMILLALQMLGVKALQGFTITPPKSLTRFVADESNFKSKFMPFLLGAGTFLLPCGFTITVEGLALASTSALQGGLIMASFALGTLPSLLAIGLSTTSLYQKPHLSDKFLKIAGILVMFFALFNLNSQLNLLGITTLSDLTYASGKEGEDDDLAPYEDGKQIIRMDAFSYSYEPSYFKVRAGIPVRWEITNRGVSGCTNAVIAKGLFDGEIRIDGDLVTKEFTPNAVGKYKFSCWMGMVSGIIEIVNDNASSGTADVNEAPVPSGASGSCGGSCSGSCGGTCGNPNCEYAQ